MKTSPIQISSVSLYYRRLLIQSLPRVCFCLQVLFIQLALLLPFPFLLNCQFFLRLLIRIIISNQFILLLSLARRFALMIRTSFGVSSMYEKGPRLSRTEIPPMITDSNQVCMAKMIDRRVQEGVLTSGEKFAQRAEFNAFTYKWIVETLFRH